MQYKNEDLKPNMKAFTFYLDDDTKLDALLKLKENNLDTTKGSLSALIRTLLRLYAANEFNDINTKISRQIREEYLYTTSKNKRSSL